MYNTRYKFKIQGKCRQDTRYKMECITRYMIQDTRYKFKYQVKRHTRYRIQVRIQDNVIQDTRKLTYKIQDQDVKYKILA